MATYQVTFIVDATMIVEVEADSEEEAREAAWAEASPQLCHACADHLEVGDCIDIHSVELKD